MDHVYIDGKKVAESYLRHNLAPEERTAFESHMVDCEECRDRLLLAELFHSRNGASKPLPPQAPQFPQRARLVAWLKPWQIWVILIAAAILLVLIPTAGVFLSR